MSKRRGAARRRFRAQVKRHKGKPTGHILEAAQAPLDNRPTREQRAAGIYQNPAKHESLETAWINRASDMIGRLDVEGKLTNEQVQAARTFEGIWRSYQDEIGVAGYGSCLDQSGGGYDGGEGNPDVYREWKALCDKIGRVAVACLRTEISKGPDGQPDNLERLRVFLERVAR